MQDRNMTDNEISGVGWKMQDWNIKDKSKELENARLQNDGKSAWLEKRTGK